MGAMDEFFGPNALRPDHPDFWRLSQIVLAADARIQEAPDLDAKEAAWVAAVDAAGDRASIMYMFGQRALIAIKGNPGALALVSRMATLAVDSFLVGVTFAKGFDPAVTTMTPVARGYLASAAADARAAGVDKETQEALDAVARLGIRPKTEDT